jgi:DNA-binding transcriptional regulator WhiA
MKNKEIKKTVNELVRKSLNLEFGKSFTAKLQDDNKHNVELIVDVVSYKLNIELELKYTVSYNHETNTVYIIQTKMKYIDDLERYLETLKSYRFILKGPSIIL